MYTVWTVQKYFKVITETDLNPGLKDLKETIDYKRVESERPLLSHF